MKKTLFLTLSILTLYACGQKTSLIYYKDKVSWDRETEIMSYKGTPFSGDITGYYTNPSAKGQLKVKENYKDGKKEGLFEKYYEDGKIRSKYTYKDGKHIGIGEVFSDNGNLLEKYTYYDGELHYLIEKYHEYNGKLRIRYTMMEKYSRSTEHPYRAPYDGVWEEYHSNGQLSLQRTFKEGYEEGISVSYYENGEIFEKETYKKGEKVRME